MKLATLKSASRDGQLIVVSKDLQRYLLADKIAPTLQYAIEHWPEASKALQSLVTQLNDDPQSGLPLRTELLASPLPRAYQWLDGSAYLSHVKRVRKARGAEMPLSFLSDPLMYQGASDHFIGPNDPIAMSSEDWGIDFEAEVCVITDDVPMGVSEEEAATHVVLVLLTNDVSLRKLIPAELAKGFGFIHGKPANAFSPVAVTLDELGEHWRDGKLHCPLCSYRNDQLFGNPDAGQDMQFNFHQLIAHAAKTRHLSAGTIIGSGTVSNEDAGRGYACVLEKILVEILTNGKAETEFLHFGERVRIEMLDHQGNNLFGSIEQKIEKPCSQQYSQKNSE